MIRTIMNNLTDIFDTLLGYMAAFLGFLVQCNWMSIGAAILLLSRLLVDVPKAYAVLVKVCNDKSNR